MGLFDIPSINRAQADARYAPLSLVNQPGLVNWHIGMAGRFFGPTRIVAIGSSTTDGNNATTLERRFVERLAKSLQANYNPTGVPGGTFYRAIQDGWTTTGTVTPVNAGISLRSLSLAALATLSRTVSSTTGFTILFAQGPSIGTFTVSIDGGTAVTVTPLTSGVTRHDGTWSSALLSAGTHTITITSSAASIIEGMYAHNNDLSSGIQMYNSGKGLTMAADFADDSSLATRIGQLAPALVLITIGSNDYANNISIATFSAKLQQIITRYKAALSTAGAPPASYVVLGSYRRLDVSNPSVPWSSYLSAMAAVAAADSTNVAYADVSAGYPSANTSAGDPYNLIDTDSVHQTDIGHAYMADNVKTVIDVRSVTASLSLTDPATMSGLIAQFRADSLSLSDTASVASWAPSSGLEAAPLAQATTTAQPIYRTSQVGGRPAVVFSSTNSQQMDTGPWTTSRPVPQTVVVVGKRTGGNLGNYYSGRNGVYTYMGAGTTTAGITVGAGNGTEMTGNASADAFHIHVIVFNGSSSAFYIDSRTPTTGTTGTIPAAALPGLRLGTNSGGTGNFLSGAIAEWAGYNRALSVSEVDAIISWYANKYSIATT
jgi:lysophospholipase L1-like esterase